MRRATGCGARRASRAGSSPAKRSRKRFRPRDRSKRPGLLQTLDYLGESVRTLAEADAATRDYLRVIDAIHRGRHRPQPVAEADAARPRRRPRERRRQPAPHPRARRRIFSSASTWRALTTPTRRSRFSRRSGSRTTGTSAWCCRRICAGPNRTSSASSRSARASVSSRARTASQRRSRTRERPTSTPPTRKLMKRLLLDGTYPAIATHDEAMIREAQRYAAEQHIGQGPVRVPDAVRHPARSPDVARRAGLPRARLHPVRPRSGFPISCGGWVNGRPTSGSCCAASHDEARVSTSRRDHRRVGGHRTSDRDSAGARRRIARDLRPAARPTATLVADEIAPGGRHVAADCRRRGAGRARCGRSSTRPSHAGASWT